MPYFSLLPILKFIRGTFKYAVELGVLARDPTPQMKFKEGNKIRQVLTEQQAGVLLNRAKEYSCQWYPHWAMALYTGMRNGELYALTWDKVNFQNRVIKVDTSWNNKDGFKSTKSGDDRMVEIAPNLLELLRQLKIEQSDSVYVLPRIDKWDKGRQAEDLRTFLEGIRQPQVTFHDLRASWATIMLVRGVEPIKVMAMGGWTELKTMQIYIRKAGVGIKGITDSLNFHNPSKTGADILNFDKSSTL